jgi:hypothetical protein
MGAQLVSTVYVQDPDTRQTVTLDAGTLPEPRLAALVTNPGAWVDGKLPRLPKTAKPETEPSNGPEGEGSGPSGDGPADASGDGSATTSDDADQTSDEPKATTATKTAAKKTAAKTPARGRTAAAEGTGGQ